MEIRYHTDRSTQSDFPLGALDICSTNPQECFQLGIIFGEMVRDKQEAVNGDWGQGRFIRIPMKPDPRAHLKEQQDKPNIS